MNIKHHKFSVLEISYKLKLIVKKTDIKTHTSLLSFGCLNLEELFGLTHHTSYFGSLELMSQYTKNRERPPKKKVCSYSKVFKQFSISAECFWRKKQK